MQCIFYNDQCLETYKKCEYYDGGVESICENIIQINGKKCYYTSKKCKTRNKICTEALTNKEECLLITKKGVMDPDTRICDMYGGYCKESYKYCSDYRGTDQSFCTNIKPYDETGENIDPTSVCVYDYTNSVNYYDSHRDVGCRRELHDCSYADSNDILCEMISRKLEISSNNKKYCAFIGGSCSEEYQTCESYDEEEYTTFDGTKCTNNKPKNYLTHKCVTKTTDGKTLCVTEEETKDCSLFNTKYPPTSTKDYKYFCTSLKPYCLYTSGSCLKKSCSEYTFDTADDNNAIRCKEIAVSDSNKMCALNSDKKGCEEIDKEVEPTDEVDEEKNEENTTDKMEIPTNDFSEVLATTNLTSTEENKNSDGFYLKRTPIIITIICLLF